MAHVLAAVIVAERETVGDALSERAEALAHRLPVGSRASKRSALRLAWTPTHSAEPWSTATNTAAWPSPVVTEVRSVPHMRSTRSVVIVPSWARAEKIWKSYVSRILRLALLAPDLVEGILGGWATSG